MIGTAVLAVSAAALAGSAVAADRAAPSKKSYLYVWSGDDDEKDSDFLAVIDADSGSASYGKVVATAPVGVRGTMPHHIEYETPPGAKLFANGWKASHSFVLDIADPLRPRVVADFKKAGEYSFAHSFSRLPNGNAIATFQSIGDSYAPPGGLVELDERGQLVRSAASATPDIPQPVNWPYSLAVIPATDRIVTTSTDMGMGPEWKSTPTSHIQLWSISDLKLLASVALPEGAKGTNHHNYPAEPRLLADGSVYVNSFNCGLYRVEGIAAGKPTAKFVHAFPWGPTEHDMCAVPVVYGKYWIQTVGAINGMVVLDTSDPDKPVEVSRLILPKSLHVPHWAAADRSTGRIAVTGMHDSWVAVLKFDEKSGRLAIDERFGEAGKPGIRFDRPDWPHGRTGKAFVHGAVFSK